MERFLVRNSIQTADGTHLVSHSLYERKQHYDQTNYNTYVIVGGIEKPQTATTPADGQHREEPIDTSVWSDEEDFEILRKAIYRGNRGESGQEQLRWVYLHEMTDTAIENAIKYLENSSILSAEQLRSDSYFDTDEEYQAARNAPLPDKTIWYIKQYRKEQMYRTFNDISIA